MPPFVGDVVAPNTPVVTPPPLVPPAGPFATGGAIGPGTAVPDLLGAIGPPASGAPVDGMGGGLAGAGGVTGGITGAGGVTGGFTGAFCALIARSSCDTMRSSAITLMERLNRVFQFILSQNKIDVCTSKYLFPNESL